jgi:diguanylate cyclase (GGDEF)-like protein
MRLIDRYRLYYILALLTIGIMTIVSHVLVGNILHTHDGFGRLINDAGRQRMYTQRLASYLLQFNLDPTEDKKAEILSILANFNKANDNLSRDFKDPKTLDTNSFYRKMHSLYFDSSDAIHKQSMQLSTLINRYLSGNTNSKENSDILKKIFPLVNHSLLNNLDQAVFLYQIESEHQIQNIDNLLKLILFLILFILLIEAKFIFNPMFVKLRQYISDLSHIALRDELTGLYNRRSFNSKFDEQVEYAQRYGNHCSVIIFDIDNFKKINDEYGHLVGDKVIKTIGRTIEKNFRGLDQGFRYGGEEFVILLPQTNIDKAIAKAEFVRKKIEEIMIHINNTENLQFTASFGVSSIAPDNVNNALAQADEALYQAKESGKNKVVKYQVGN